MDYSKFQDENFDVKDWVNNAFKNAPGNTSKDQYATTLVMKLQMFIQEVNNMIEDASQQAIQNLPRVMRDVEAVRQESALLQDQMRMVKEDIEKVEIDTAYSMQTLLRLDNIKTKMKAASDALQEADNWTTLSADVEEVFESQDIKSISAKLVGMQQSLQMLVDVPDYTERVQHLEDLKNRLEAMLSTQIVAAFNAHSLEAAQVYVKTFTDINRLPQLYKYYHKCHKNQLLQSWKSIIETNSDDAITEWLPEFYDLLLSSWHNQIKWCSQVFRQPVEIVCDLLRETLTSMDPSPQHCIVSLLQEKPDSLTVLIDLKQITDRFAKSMEVALESYTNGSLQELYIEKLVITIFSPYQRYVNKYGAFEDKFLSEELDNIRLDTSEIIDNVRLLGESVSKVFSVASTASSRCVEFTNGCGYPDCLQALESYFKKYLKEFRRVLVNLREKCKLDSASEEEDWSLFQHSLRLIQTCGDLLLRIEEFDQTVISDIMNSIGKHYQPTSSPSHKPTQRSKINPFHDYKCLLLESKDDQAAVDHLLTKLEEGDTPSVLPTVKKDMCKLSQEVHKFAFDIVFAQLKKHLSNVSNMENWTSQTGTSALLSDLPTFSLSPQEYITKIGQYLLTLPQQLEPFTMEHNPAIIVALKHGRLPFTDESAELPDHIADLWLESIARGTMHTYCEEILKIHDLSAHATKQLITDIDYLCNVLEDLDLHPSEMMKNVATLLKVPGEEYSEEAEKMPLRLTSAIASMRHLRIE
ncbi:conserved oligomeric Golgi complex subunit 7-like [Tubulanus polymorphus]|uniref:conserved oligomeric Golgi complex subunit 7-like n=1 Tax=Tubulanus polymorphus TaxID=672921 RepID=UPI003DA4E8B6